MFEFKYETRYGDYKDFDVIKTGAVLDIIQDVSIRDSESRGYGIHVLHEMGEAWLVQGINFRLVKPISTHYPVVAQTGVAKIGGVTSNRGCILRQNGEICAKSIANWFLMNTNEGKLARISKEMTERYELYDFGDEFFKYHKPTPPEFTGDGDTVEVAVRDIDTNRHLNNEKAVEIILDALPFDFSYNAIDIMYKRESHLGDNLTRRVVHESDGYWVELAGCDGESNVVAHIWNE